MIRLLYCVLIVFIAACAPPAVGPDSVAPAPRANDVLVTAGPDEPILMSGLDDLESRNFEPAIEKFNKVIEMAPDNARAYFGLAIAYQELGELDRAVQYMNKHLELRPSNQLGYSARGFMYFEMEQYEKALQDQNKAIELDPQFAEPYIYLGQLAETLGNHEEAVQNYEKFLELAPNSPLSEGIRDTIESLKARL